MTVGPSKGFKPGSNIITFLVEREDVGLHKTEQTQEKIKLFGREAADKYECVCVCEYVWVCQCLWPHVCGREWDKKEDTIEDKIYHSKMCKNGPGTTQECPIFKAGFVDR